MSKEYWVQVEGEISPDAIEQLCQGVMLKDGITRPAKVSAIAAPDVGPRPSDWERKSIPTSWIRVVIKEGRNRQVRRMTAAVGFPTLRLIRYRIGSWTLDAITHGEYEIIEH